MAAEIAPGAVIGILGGGQLGRMLSIAAAQLGYRCHIYAPEPVAPAGDVSWRLTTAPYEDESALAAFADTVDVITYEFENVPEKTVAFLGALKPVRPGQRALATAQDRLREKQFARELNIQTAAFAEVGTGEELATAIDTTGLPAVLKTRRFGYDGKGQAFIRRPDEAGRAWLEIGAEAAILEAFVDFEREISVLAARTADGRIRSFPPVENSHRNHILDVSRVPARIDDDCARRALDIAEHFLVGLDYIGVLTIELFVTADGGLLLNEIAPRVHNSGHWSIEGAPASQFEQHIRAICGLPLGDPRPYGRVEMSNLIGDDIDRWRDYLAEANCHLHLYGKRDTRPGRKMGHVTRIWPD